MKNSRCGHNSSLHCSTYVGIQAGLSSVQAYNAAGSAIRMDGATVAAPGYESVLSDFNSFNFDSPNIGNKLEYAFGNATGSPHNISRSIQNENNLNSIGIFDNEKGRTLMNDYLQEAYNQRLNGVLQDNGRIKVNTLVSGPNGLLNMETIWDGSKLITINTYKSSWTSIVGQ